MALPGERMKRGMKDGEITRLNSDYAATWTGNGLYVFRTTNKNTFQRAARGAGVTLDRQSLDALSDIIFAEYGCDRLCGERKADDETAK